MIKAGGDEEDEGECFYESLDRIHSSSTTSCSSPYSSDCDNDRDPNSNSGSPRCAPNGPTAPRFPMVVSSNYDVWISEPSSVEVRRTRLLRELGLSRDLSFSRHRRSHTAEADCGGGGRSEVSDHLNDPSQVCLSFSNINSNTGMVRSISDGDTDHHNNNSSPSSSHFSKHKCKSNSFSIYSSEILSINSISSPSMASVAGGGCGTSVHSLNNSQNGNVGLVKSRSGNGSPVTNAVSPNKPPTGRNSRRIEDCRTGSTRSCPNVSSDSSTVNNGVCRERDTPLDCNANFDGLVCVDDSVCMIKNLDNGKEFVVNEVREDGMWNKLKEVDTGKQLTMEEFEICLGHSPIIQELMRRQNVEDGNKDNLDMNPNGVVGSSSKSKKKGSWLKSIKNVANSMTGHKERRSSDERDTSSEKGGRRSSSATDDSQDGLFHGPERVRIRQYGKSCKELSALYKSQEIQAHNGSIWTIRFSLDGKYLASAGEDCVIHVWMFVESERKGELQIDKPEDGNFNFWVLANGSPEPTSVSPNVDGHSEKKRRGRSSISRKSVSLDNVVVPETVFALSEKPICSFQGHLDDVLDLSWSKSQHLLSSSMDKTVRLWHLSSKSCLKVFSHNDYVTCIQFNPVDDRYFISGSLDAKVRIWSIPDRQVVDWNDLHEMVTAACYTPDGQGALVGSYKGSCRMYNTSENKLQQKGEINLQNKKKKGHHRKITGFQFAPGSSSEVLVTSADSRIRVIDGVDLVHKFKGFHNTHTQISASLTASGKYVVSASEDSHVYIWKHEIDSRPNRTKGISVTNSYEYFHCQDVSLAIPWPGICETWRYRETDNSDEENNGLLPERISATWPEEKLLLAAKNCAASHGCVDFLNQSRLAWGMVIVTAGLRGEIRTFQNFGLPVRI